MSDGGEAMAETKSDEACDHTVSGQYTVAQVREALSVVRKAWRRIRRAAGADAESCGRMLRRLSETVSDCPSDLARWRIADCGDWKPLVMAMREAGVEGGAFDVVADAVEACAAGYWNGAAACEEEGCAEASW